MGLAHPARVPSVLGPRPNRPIRRENAGRREGGPGDGLGQGPGEGPRGNPRGRGPAGWWRRRR